MSSVPITTVPGSPLAFFEPPEPGRFVLVTTMIISEGQNVEIPVLYYRRHDGTPLGYPFTRQRLGEIWSGQKMHEMTFQNVRSSSPNDFLADVMDMPPRCAQVLVWEIERNGGGLEGNVTKLLAWLDYAVGEQGALLSMESCCFCHAPLPITLRVIAGNHGMRHQVSCQHLGRMCANAPLRSGIEGRVSTMGVPQYPMVPPMMPPPNLVSSSEQEESPQRVPSPQTNGAPSAALLRGAPPGLGPDTFTATSMQGGIRGMHFANPVTPSYPAPMVSHFGAQGRRENQPVRPVTLGFMDAKRRQADPVVKKEEFEEEREDKVKKERRSRHRECREKKDEPKSRHHKERSPDDTRAKKGHRHSRRSLVTDPFRQRKGSRSSSSSSPSSSSSDSSRNSKRSKGKGRRSHHHRSSRRRRKDSPSSSSSTSRSPSVSNHSKDRKTEEEQLPFTTLRPKDPLYPHADRQRKGSGWLGDKAATHRGQGVHLVHPSRVGPGGLLDSLTTEPPTKSELRELRKIQIEKGTQNLLSNLNKAISAKTVQRYRGRDEAKEFLDWRDSLVHHFGLNGQYNTGLQGWLALNTLDEKAKLWWLAQQGLRPRLILSFDQLVEWMQHELVPSAVPSAAMDPWMNLKFKGNLEEYFKEVERLDVYYPVPPATAQVMASRPFGHALERRVRAADAAQNYVGLRPNQWQDIVREFVEEEEQKPSFRSWSNMDTNPRHQSARLRCATTTHVQPEEDVQTEEEIMDGDETAPPGITEEEWDARLAFGTVTTGGKPARIGEGPTPCFCCGEKGHTWIRCDQKKKGKCAVCGSQDHWTRQCDRRFRPHPTYLNAPNLRNPVRNNDQLRSSHPPVNSAPRTNPSPPVITQGTSRPPFPQKTTGMGDSRTGIPKNPKFNQAQAVHEAEDSAEMEKNKEEGMEHERGEDDKNEGSGVSLLQVRVSSTHQADAPSWVHQRVIEQSSRRRLGKPVYPLTDPAKVGQLIYPATANGAEGRMLYDPGASHCFVDSVWAQKAGLRVSAGPTRTTLHHFQGSAKGAIKGLVLVDNFQFAGQRYRWRFLAIHPAPADIVMGLEFLMKHQPVVDMRTFALWATAPKGEEVPSTVVMHQAVCKEEDLVEDTSIAFLDEVRLQTARAITPSTSSVWDDGMPVCEDGRLFLLSVTGNTWEEGQDLEALRLTLPVALQQLVSKHLKVFSPPDAEPPARSVTHAINLLPDAVPVKRRPYPLPEHKLTAMKTQVTDLAKNRWIEPSNSPWGAPILFVPKKNGELRMCVDFRDLNAVTVDDSFPLPRIEVMLHRASKARIFSKLDLASGFHQIEVEPDSRPLTAFRLPEAVEGSSLWQWKVMPFGLRNAPPTFQRAMSVTLAGLDHCAVVYIDDILIFSQNEEEHVRHLDQVFTALGNERYHMRLPKCEFMKEEVEFLGHRLSKEGISTQADKVKAVRDWATPFHTRKQVKSFLGVAVWYRIFIPRFSSLAAPLFELTSVKRRFQWNEACESAVTAIKDALTSAPVLARWDPALPTRIITDASKVGVGAALEQQHQDQWRPVAFWSRKLKDAETRYSATDLEWMAVVIPVTRVWHWMLEGVPFKVLSDHKALGTKLHKGNHDPPLNDRQSRWVESLAPFSFDFEWIPGQDNTVADALSRYPVQVNSATVIHALLAGLEHRLKLAARADMDYSRLRSRAQHTDSSYRLWRDLVVDAQDRIMVPADSEIRTLLIAEAHDSPMAGHFGMDRTMELLQRHWSWKGMQRDVREYVKSCTSCQRIKHSTSKPAGVLHPIVAKYPWHIVTLDFVSGLPPATNSQLSQVLVIVDKFSKYTILEPCPSTMTALDTAKAFIRRVIANFGLPKVVISDRGPQFSAAVWKAILEGMGAKVALATSHHPQTDGQTERAIQTLLRIVRSFAVDQAADWQEMLPLFQFAINNAASSASRLSPFQILFGVSPLAPTSVITVASDEAPGQTDLGLSGTAAEWARRWWKARRRLRQFVSQRLEASASLMKRRYDKGRRPLDLQPGDLVLLSVKSHNAFHHAKKMALKYTGPYVVKSRPHQNAYELDGLPAEVPSVQNVSFLRYFLPSPPRFASRPASTQGELPVQVGDHVEWEVDAILGHRERGNALQYLVKWMGHPQTSWLYPRQLRHCAEMLNEYQSQQGLAMDSWTSSSSSPESSSHPEDEEMSDGPDSDQEASLIVPPAPQIQNPVTPSASTHEASDMHSVEVQVTGDQEERVPETPANPRPPPRRSTRLANHSNSHNAL